MSVAYKYCDARGVEIVKNLELKVTPPNQFNDPFEFAPNIIAVNPLRKAREVLKGRGNADALHQKFAASGLFFGCRRAFRRYVKHNREKMAKEMAPNFPSAARDVQRMVLDNVSKAYGVLCLSKKRDSILMWGHYCDKHSGIVIGFDSSNEMFQHKSRSGLCPVDYVAERVVFDATWKKFDPQILAFEEKMIFSKNIDWTYERELRLFLQLKSLTRKPLADGSPGFFLPTPPEAFVSVTLGARCSLELENKVRSALKQPRFSHVKLDRAVLHQSRFELEFV